MICPVCSSESFTESFTRYDYSKECGLEGVFIESAKRFDCVICKNVMINVGQIHEIDRELFRQIACLKSPTMTAAQLKFVRTKLFKDNFDQLADRTGIDATVLYETEENNLLLNPELTDYIRGHIASEMITPESVSIIIGDKKTEIFNKKDLKGS